MVRAAPEPDLPELRFQPQDWPLCHQVPVAARVAPFGALAVQVEGVLLAALVAVPLLVLGQVREQVLVVRQVVPEPVGQVVACPHLAPVHWVPGQLVPFQLGGAKETLCRCPLTANA